MRSEGSWCCCEAFPLGRKLKQKCAGGKEEESFYALIRRVLFNVFLPEPTDKFSGGNNGY